MSESHSEKYTNIKVYYWYRVLNLLSDKIRLGICFYFLGRLGFILCLGFKIVFIKIKQSFFFLRKDGTMRPACGCFFHTYSDSILFFQAKDGLFATCDGVVDLAPK